MKARISYGQIAMDLSLSKNIVSSFCKISDRSDRNRVINFVNDYESAALSQNEFDTKYNKLNMKYDEAYAKCQDLVKLKEHDISQSNAIKLFIKVLKEKSFVLDDWNSSCWHYL